MDKSVIYSAGTTLASRYAAKYLRQLGLAVGDTPWDSPTDLMLDVPSFGPGGKLRGGGSLEDLLQCLPRDITVYGGKLDHPALAGYRTVDFLKDPIYLAENAYLTAECALDVALPYLKITLRRCPVLVIGWGRIGKCLARLLESIGSEVTVAARKSADRAMAHAMGYGAEDPAQLEPSLHHYKLIFNTVPASVLTQEQLKSCPADCIKIDLASSAGMEGDDVIIARGLPGIHVPKSSGQLIAETYLRLQPGREGV